MKILIVDDEPGTRLTVTEAVERLGHRALQAADGTEGLQAFELHHPEVVITDWAMPQIDGTELIARIRDRERGYTYILLLSGRAGDAASREAVRAGADDVLSKPLDAAELERGLIAAERIRGVHRRMLEDTRRDPLTGVGSRRRLEEDLATLCARVVRYGHAYCVAMVGLEPADDDVLRQAGAALVREIRSGDSVYRWGASEFAVLLPEQALVTANVAAERLRHALAVAVPGGTKVHVGIVTTGGGEPVPAELLERAEAAMRRSAQTGGVEDSESAGVVKLRLVVADDDPVSRLMLGAILKREPGLRARRRGRGRGPGGGARAAAAAGRRPARRRHARWRRRAGRGADPRGAARGADRGDQRRRFAELSVRHDARGRGGLRDQGLVGRRDPARDP